MGNGEKKTIHYDKILKNLFNISNRLTIYALNALFKKNFKENAKIEQLNREYIRLDKTTAIADTVLSIEINEQKTKYHIEFQTISDRTLIIRMIDYGFRIAIDDLDYSKIKAGKEITIEFPSQIIIFLKHNKSIPDLQDEYRKKITEVIESIIKELKDALKTDDLIIEECNKILLELSTLSGELFSEEVKDIEQEVNEMVKMIIDPEIYRRYEEGMEKGKTIINQELYKKGIEEGIEKGIAETVVKLLCRRFGELPVEYKERIQGQDRPTLELIADHFFDIESLSDLERFLRQ